MKTNKTFLNFYKLVLEKMKFDQQLFWKEYQKALKFLNDKERNELNKWVCRNYHKKKVSLN